MASMLPDDARLQSNYNDTKGAVGAAALILGIAAAAILAFGDGIETLVAGMAILGGFWSIVILVIGLNNHRIVRRERTDRDALLHGEWWAEWQYSPAEWQVEIEKRRAELERWEGFQRKWGWIMIVVSTAAIGGTPLVIALIGLEGMPDRMPLFLFGLALFLAVLSVALSRNGIARERRKRQAWLDRAERLSTPRLRFGAFGFYHEADGHTTLRRLAGVRFSAAARTLTFVIRHNGPHGSSIDHPTSIMVPAAHVEDANALVKRYRQERGL